MGNLKEKMGRRWQRTRSMARGCGDMEVELWSTRTACGSPGREEAHWRNSVWGQSGIQVGGAGDREGMSRLVRKKADALSWNVFLGHSVFHRGLLGTGRG